MMQPEQGKTRMWVRKPVPGYIPGIQKSHFPLSLLSQNTYVTLCTQKGCGDWWGPSKFSFTLRTKKKKKTQHDAQVLTQDHAPLVG